MRDSSWSGRGGGSVFPGPNRAVGGARGLGRGGSRRAVVPAWVKGPGGLGRSGRWADLWGWRAGVLGPQKDRDWCPPNPQRGPSCPRHEASQQAPVSGKVFIQRDYSSGTRCQFQTKFPRSFGEPGTQLGSRTRVLGRGGGTGCASGGPGTAGAWARVAATGRVW